MSLSVRATAMLAASLLSTMSYAQVLWDMPTSISPNNFLTGVANEFAADVKKSTNGKLVITIHPGGSLFRQEQIKRAVQTGQAQIGDILLTSYSNEDQIFGIDSLPFVTSNYKQAWDLWRASKPGTEATFAKQGMMVLYSAPLPPQGIYSKTPIRTVTDLKGAKWRAYSPLTSRLGELVGAQPLTIMSSELAQALATGAVNAFMTSSGTGYDTKVYEQVKYFYDTQAWIPKNLMIVNKKAFDALDKPIQEAVRAAADTAEKKAWKLSEEKHAWYLQQLAANGMTVQPPSPELAAQLKAIGKQMQAEWVKSAGPAGRQALETYERRH